MEVVNKSLNTIKIGFKQYTIEKPDEIDAVDGNYAGTQDYGKSKIRVANSLEQDDQNYVFLHELIHCICCRFDLRKLNKDEHTIDLLSLGLYETIRDNPHIFTMSDI